MNTLKTEGDPLINTNLNSKKKKADNNSKNIDMK